MALDSDVLESIITALEPSGISEPAITLACERLDSFGYAVSEDDAWMIGFSIQKTEAFIKNECNLSEIPERMRHAVADRACGEFLFAKKQTGQLNLEPLDLSGAVSSVKEGDMQVTFKDGESDSDKLDSLIDFLLNRGKGELACFRKLRW